MRKWAVFKAPHYYPHGGMGDFVEAFDTKDEADTFAAGIAQKSYDVMVEDMEEYLNKAD